MVITEKQFLELGRNNSFLDRREGVFKFFFEQPFDLMGTDHYATVIKKMGHNYMILRDLDYTWVEPNLEELPFDFQTMPSFPGVHIMNLFFLSESVCSAWIALRNGLRDEILKNKDLFYPRAMGQLETWSNIQLGDMSLTEYCLSRGETFGLNWEQIQYSLLEHKYRISYKIHYFVSKDGNQVYITMDPYIMNLKTFLTFLTKFLFVVAKIDRIHSTVSLTKENIPLRPPKKETDESRHWDEINDRIKIYKGLFETYKDEMVHGKRTSLPTFEEVQQYLFRFHYYLKKFHGDFSGLRPSGDYDPVEALGGLEALFWVFNEQFYFCLLRSLIQGSLADPHNYPVGFYQKTFMEKMGHREGKRSQHFNFLWDINLTMSAKEYYEYSVEGLHHPDPAFRNYTDETLMYDPSWIPEDLVKDLTIWLDLIRPDVTPKQENMLPVFGFDLHWEGLKMERSRTFDSLANVAKYTHDMVDAKNIPFPNLTYNDLWFRGYAKAQ